MMMVTMIRLRTMRLLQKLVIGRTVMNLLIVSTTVMMKDISHSANQTVRTRLIKMTVMNLLIERTAVIVIMTDISHSVIQTPPLPLVMTMMDLMITRTVMKLLIERTALIFSLGDSDTNITFSDDNDGVI